MTSQWGQLLSTITGLAQLVIVGLTFGMRLFCSGYFAARFLGAAFIARTFFAVVFLVLILLVAGFLAAGFLRLAFRVGWPMVALTSGAGLFVVINS